MCSICSLSEIKYKCPKCEVSTCSLDCVKKHKQIGDCDGIRSQTKFVSLTNFDDCTTLSDYRFLENISRYLDTSGRTCIDNVHQRNLNHQRRLMTECRTRCCFLRLPSGNFPGSHTRAPFFNIQEKKIYWHIKWNFVHSDIQIESERVPEDLTLGEALEALFMNQSHPLYKHLLYYISASFRNIIPLIRVPRVKDCKRVFEELDFSKSLTSNWYGKSINECLTVDLILNEHKHIYLAET